MQIRKATQQDEARIIDLLKQFPVQEITVDWSFAAEAFQRIIEDPGLGSILVAAEDGEILGVATLSYPFAIRCGGLYASLEEFIVDGRFRGKGVGGALMRAVIEEAKSKGCYEIQVNNPSEMGYPVYLRYGLKDLGKHLRMELGNRMSTPVL